MTASPLRLALVCSLLLLPACDDDRGDPTDGGSSGSDSGNVDSGSVDSGSSDGAVPTDAGDDVCGYVADLDRTCTADGDCAVGLHQTDCCGNSVMIGFNSTEQATYASSESACMMTYPDCDCPAALPTTDSGEMVTDTSAVQAACVSSGPQRICLTYVTMRPTDTP